MESKDTDLQFLSSSLLPFLRIGRIFPFFFFHWSGNIPVRRQFWNRSFNRFKLIFRAILNPNWDITYNILLTSRDLRIFKISGSAMVTGLNNEVKIAALFNFISLLLFKEHWFAKKSLKWLAFYLQWLQNDYSWAEEV